MENEFSTLAEETNSGTALNVQAICWFITWGNMTGNTLTSFITQYGFFIHCISQRFFLSRICCNPKQGSWLWFEILFFLYWGPLFVIVFLCGKLFGLFPKVPKCVMGFLGCVLWTTAMLWIVPCGILCLLFIPCFGCIKDEPEYAEKDIETNQQNIIAE